MRVLNLLLALLPALFAFSEVPVPAGWTCRKLSQIQASDESCISTADYVNGVWTITTDNSKVPSSARTDFCVIELSGDNVEDNKDFLVRAKFSANTGNMAGPFAGISYNMEDIENGDYVMMRMKLKSPSNVQAGYMDNGKSHMVKMAKQAQNSVASASEVTITIKNNGDQEDVYFDGALETELSKVEPHFSKAGAVGFAFQNVMSWRSLKISGAEVCAPFTCTDDDGTVYSGGDSWEGEEGRTCTCTENGIVCVCGDDSLNCGGLEKWVDPDTCEAKCIRTPGYCYSSGDPHYRTFDGRYYDFHGMCTYQAASCGDFVVNFKNIDFYNSAPRYTGRIELLFKGEVFSITKGYVATVGGAQVQVPYVKTYTNGDRVEIRNNGQLEILLYNKGRNPSVRARGSNAGSYINAELWLHGSCADETNGLCGTYNGNSGDDTTNGDQFKEYDENCPAPPPPYHPCNDLGEGGKEAAMAICDALKAAPFTACHATVPIGDEDNGVYAACLVDVCHCFLDQSCACSQMDSYAETCANSGVDLSTWRESVAFCPYDCPDGQVYDPAGAIPAPTCLDKDAEQTGTARGCFCPDGQYLQDNVCVDANQCRCLHEGAFYDNGATIVKEGECLTCTCQDAGEMVCTDMNCPEINCDDDELVSYLPDKCCPYCNDEWVIAVNPEETVKKGQDVVFTCEIRAEGVKRKNIKWYKGDNRIFGDTISKDKLRLTIKDADADDHATYRCEAEKDGKVASDDFELTVVMPAICEHEDGHTWEEGETYNPQDTEECTCDAHGEHTCACIDDGVECEDPTPVAWFNDNCMKTCVPDYGVCTAAADPHYSTFDGTGFAFKGDCEYQFFGCQDIVMYADHAKDEASTRTKSLTIEFKTDKIKLEGNVVTLNGDEVAVPLHKSYKDGSVMSIADVGNYKFSVARDGMEPFVELTWDRVSSYSVKAHGVCKGDTTGMCGTWNDNADDDFLQPDGTTAANAEDFGTAWAVDDETDCPVPPPPPDMCEIMGYGDREGLESHYKKVLGSGSLGKCAKVVDSADTLTAATDEACVCFGDTVCGCTILENYAAQCDAAGVDTSNWQMDNKFTECAPECPEGSVFKAKGPKPAPTCNNPNGGRKVQKGCFCPDGEVMEGGECVDVDTCQCEYAGQRYDIGEVFKREAECEECTCVGVGDVQCGEMECNVNCDDDELEVEVEDQCCPICMADWLSAVNPDAEGMMNQPLELVCKVKDGIDISGAKVKWFSGTTEITKKKAYTVSDDGLSLTINKMDTMKEGTYKCQVDMGGKTSEAAFEVTLPLRHEDLIEPVKETVAFVEGGKLVLEVKKLGGTIKEIYWECNGVRLYAKDKGIKIQNGAAFNRLTISDATLDNVGTCTCYANGIGTYDTADIEISGEENEITITAIENPVTCTVNKKPCMMEFSVTSLTGKVIRNDMRICKLNDDGSVSDDCVIPKASGDNVKRGFGKTKATQAGDYVLIYAGVQSDPCTLNLVQKVKKTKKTKKQQ